VFTHTPIDTIGEALAHVGRLLKPNGYFDFTYGETAGPARDFLREDFYYSTQQLVDLARSHGLTGEKMQDWITAKRRSGCAVRRSSRRATGHVVFARIRCSCARSICSRSQSRMIT
jgi:hypothetical protein